MTKMMDSSFLSRLCQILVVGNNHAVFEQVSAELGDEGFDVLYRSPEDLSLTLETEWVDVVLIDRTIPTRTATALCRLIRNNVRASLVPILIVDDNPDDESVIENLRAGADDCVSMNMRHALVVGRIKTLIRRRAACDELADMGKPLSNMIQVGVLTIKLNEYEVRVGGERVQLSLGEFRLLALLASRPKQTLTREQIITALGDIGEGPGNRAVDARVYTLRRKLGRASRYIRTVRGVGFKMDAV